MTQKIIIFGFPHCGTSILKSIIGHIDEVEEIYHETLKINNFTDKQFILCKFPFMKSIFFEKEYEDYIKIFIIRNPLFVFSSLNKRFNYNIPSNHSINVYINTIKTFIKYTNNTEENVYTIRYEDIFDSNFRELRILLNKIGMNYDNNIFSNAKYTNVICPGVKLQERQPNNRDHESFRTWQINQPFILRNDISKLDLSENQKQILINDKYILEIYPDINKIS